MSACRKANAEVAHRTGGLESTAHLAAPYLTCCPPHRWLRKDKRLFVIEPERCPPHRWLRKKRYR